MAKFAVAEKQRAKGPAQLVQLLPRNAAASQADDIKSIERRVLATGKTKRNDIIGHTADAADHDALADPHKLVNRRITPEEGFASDARMAAQRNVFGEGHIVADIAVMPHMRPGHQTAAVADPGYTAAGRGADIHRRQFAQLATRADNELVWFATIVHRLRWRAE